MKSLLSRVDVYNALSNMWTVVSLSQGRYLLAATSVGNLALFAGGYISGGLSTTVAIYNTLSNTWTTADLLQGRYLLVATSVGNLALFAGGYDGGGYSSVVDIFNFTFATSPSPSPCPSPIPNRVPTLQFNGTDVLLIPKGT